LRPWLWLGLGARISSSAIKLWQLSAEAGEGSAQTEENIEQSLVRTETFVCDAAEKAAPKTASVKMQAKPKAMILREIIDEILLQAIWPGAGQINCV
jgi:hypothetical protein